MLVKILGILDILTVIAIITNKLLPQQILIIMALYLIIKGFIFIFLGGIFPNFLDMLCGFYIALISYGVSHWILNVIVIIYLLQKAIISLF